MEGKKIYEALANVLAELPAIKKDQKGYGYMFRGINDALNTLNPLFKKYKIVTSREVVTLDHAPRVNSKGKEVLETKIHCKYHFTSLEDGSTLTSEGFGEGQDSSGGDKSMSMATSNAYKYVIFELFNIATEDQKDSDQVTAKEAEKENSKFTKNTGKSFRKGDVL